MIEAHDTRTVHMRLGSEGQSVDAESSAWRSWPNKATSLMRDRRGCKMFKGDRSVTLDVVKSSLRVYVKAHKTANEARNADARHVAPVLSELLVELSSSSSPS